MNPLSKHFRNPKIYIKLPSGGKWYAPGSLNMPETGELPVMSMTGRDELMVKNADALMNGAATVEMIQSCIPNIRDAWQIPRSDIDTILLAVRIATYGAEMQTTSKCPHCSHSNEHTVDCTWILDNIKQPDWDATASLGDLILMLKPAKYQTTNMINMDSYEEGKMLNQLNQPGISDEQKTDIIGRTMKKMAGMLADRLASSIDYILTPDGVKVTDSAQIREFIDNADKETFDQLRKLLENYTQGYSLPRLSVSCEECGKQYDTAIEFDPSNFFVRAS